MKFFGWGRKKDPPPLRNSQELKLQYSDIEYESVEVDQSAKELSREYSALADHLDAAAVTTWEERLQETIRFVFSHEQEGLLAIGTFALDQLVDQKFPPSSPATVTDQSTSDSSSTNTTVIHEVRSSDDEAESTDHSTTRKGLVSDYPVFGDPGSIKALSLDDDHKLPEIRTSGSHSPTKQFVDSDDQTGALCGLFPVFRSRRRKPPEKKKKKKKVVAENTISTKAGTSLGAHLGRLWRSGCSTGGATHVSARVAPEKDPKTDSPTPTQGPPCIANCVEELSVASEVGEHRKRRSGPSFGNLGWPPCAHNGNWIRTDSEFVVLEM